jgi:hypothetical protein
MGNRLPVGKAFGRLLPCLIPVMDGLFGQCGVGQMAGKHFRTVGSDFRELLLKNMRDARVQLEASALEQTIVGGFLN